MTNLQQKLHYKALMSLKVCFYRIQLSNCVRKLFLHNLRIQKLYFARKGKETFSNSPYTSTIILIYAVRENVKSTG